MSFQLPENPLAAHRAVVWLRAEVHEVLDTGECSGRPVHKVEDFPVYLEASNRADCVRLLSELLERIKAQCST